MADAPESKPAFWTSLPGILTGLGGLVVAVTGLITALYSTGVIGEKANSNTAPPVNSGGTLTVVPSPSPSQSLDTERYKALTGKWRVVEEPPQDPYFDKSKRITWEYEASVKGNTLTLTGRILFIDHVNDPPVKGEKLLNATLETSLNGLNADGEYRFTKMDGEPVGHLAKIQLRDSLMTFEAEVTDKAGGKIHRLKGRKL